MYIKNIVLKNFRNYDDAEVSFSKKYNVFFGDNGEGKTNILESISVISGIKSFRGSSDEEMIKKGKDYYYCRGKIFDDEEKIMEVGYGKEGIKKKKKVKINGREIERFSDFFGIFLTTVISPDDVNLIKSAPETKRKYFDSYLAKVNNQYTETIVNFRKALTNRTSVIKKIKEGKYSEKKHLDVWNYIFAEESSKIIFFRKNFIEMVNIYFSEALTDISGSLNVSKIKYINSLSLEEKEDILKKLEKNYKREIALGVTAQGPQRDNYIFTDKNHEDCIPYCSQGQKRAIALALKCSEIIYFEKKFFKKPTVLVDDVFSELDEKRRTNVFNFFKNGYQVIFTTVYPESIINKGFDDCTLFNVKSGKVYRI